jgi:hypothetical protein
MSQLLVIVLGLVVGVGGSRVLRGSSGRPKAASVARSAAGAVGGRRDLDLPHLQRSVLSEMMASVDRHASPPQVAAQFLVRLHPDDYDTVDQAPGFFKQGLEEAMANAGRDHGWSVPARLRIELVADPERHPGAPGVTTVDTRATVAGAAAPEPAPPAILRGPAAARPADPRPAATARLERADGPPERLRSPGTTIGRGSDQDIRVADNRASRHHATIAHTSGRFTLTDDGSSNGTRLNGQPLAAHTTVVLADGDTIGIGPVTFTFRDGSPA